MLKLSKQIPEKAIPLLFTCVYGFGLLWFNLPFTRELFISSIPLSLVLLIGLVFGFHKAWKLRTVLVFALIAILAFVFEWIGVNSGFPFGSYRYERGLGWMFQNTPLLIGLNWLFLVYSSQGIAIKFSDNRLIIMLLGASLMLCYDFVLEWVAPIMQMWHFTSSYPPIENFISWFAISCLFHWILIQSKIKVRNATAAYLFFIQMGFFGMIAILGYCIA